MTLAQSHGTTFASWQVQGSPTTTRILVVEDEQDIAGLIKHTLEREPDTRVEMVNSGDAALKAVAEQAPHLIILDLNLPRRSGHEVLADIKDDPELRRIPVAVLTTSNTEADVVASYDLGANCYLTKPVDVGQFLKVVQSIEDFWFGVVRLPPR